MRILRSTVPFAYLLLAASNLPSPLAGQAPPGTDIWILKLGGGGTEVFADGAIRATSREGYDNQPHFLPGEQYLLYTSIDATGQADIVRFDYREFSTVRLTRTHPESEYSAALMPSGTRFTVIRVEADSTQRLWSFDFEGGNPQLILPGVQPVGYHTWIDETLLALFVLGSPATLQLASPGREEEPPTGESRVVAENIGRSLHTIPGTRKVSFVQWEEPGDGWITELDPETEEARVLAPLLEGNEFYAWTAGGALLMGNGSKLFRWEPGESEDWRELADLTELGIREISRIAVSPEGNHLAVVGAH
ncbi:TolB family protein [Gemmatimonadota bacterium]